MSKELIAKRSKLLADRKAIATAAETESRAFTADETAKITAMKTEYDGICATLAEMGDRQAQEELMDKAARGAVNRPSEEDRERDIGDKDLKGYSMLRAIKCMAAKRPVDGLEGEMSAHLEKAYGLKSPRGIYVPSRVWVQPRAAAVDTTTGSGAVSTVTTSYYIDALRNLTILGGLGLTFLEQLQGKLAIPRSAGITSYWPGEGTAVTAGAITVDSVTLSPKTVGAYSDFTRSWMEQTSLSTENFARDQIFRSMSSAICSAVMNGTGGTNIPLGVLNNTACSEYIILSGTSSGSGPVPANLTGSTITFASMVAGETLVGAQNVMIDTGAYVTSSAGRGVMKITPKSASAVAAGFIWDGTGAPNAGGGGGSVNGYPAFATNCMPSSNGTNTGVHAALFGNWRDGMVGMWGTMDLTIDPYALATSGGLRVIGLQDVDFQLKHPQSFCRIYGIAP